jgi:monoamine oxidase
MLTRRSLLTGFAAASATRLPVSAAATGNRPDVLVIGAGLSGLYSALLLEDAGARVKVLEGRNRIGGRLYTLFDLPGHPEVGGNTIASGYGRVIDTARRLDVELIDYAPRLFSGPPPELVLAGELIRAADWPRSPRNPFPEAHRALLPWQLVGQRLAGTNPLEASTDWLAAEHAALDQPLDQYFLAKGLSEPEIRLGYDTNPYFGDTAASVSALMYLFNQRWIDEQRSIGRAAYAVAGGNQRLPLAMAAALNEEVRADHEVAAIEVMPDRVRVRLRDGSTIDAGQVICSLPVSKLRDVDIQPRVSGPQARLFRSLRYMRNSLMFLVPREPFWEKDGLAPSMWTDGIAGVVTAQRFGDDPDEVTGIVVNARGWTADYMDRLGTENAAAAVIAEIERLRPAAKGALEFGGYHSWWQDRFSAGDWAIHAPGQVSELLPHVADSHGRLHFCGEHAGQANRGMEAAMESAERAVIAASAYL